MSRDSDRHSAEEMERIRRGLEDFLNQQMQEEDTEDWDAPPRRKRSGQAAKGTRAQKGGNAQRSTQSRNGSKSQGGGKSRGSSKSRKGNKSQKSSKTQKSNNAPKKRSRFKRFLFLAAMLVLLILGGAYFLVGTAYSKLNYAPIESVKGEPLKDEGIINILLIGSDSRENGVEGRSDAMILLSVNKQTKKIYMTSLLRDMYVELPGHNNNRLNAAYSYGGAELLMETIEQNFDIQVNRYAVVNFQAFANLVDAVGGVDLELTTGEIEYVNGYLQEYNMLTDRPQGTDNMDPSASGMVHLNGPQALAYSRNRYIGTDFGRTERQRKVLTEVIRKLPGAAVTSLGELIDGLMPNLTTNLTQWECYTLTLQAPGFLGYEIVQGSIPLEGTYSNATIRGMSVLQVDFEANKRFLRDTVYGKGEVSED